MLSGMNKQALYLSCSGEKTSDWATQNVFAGTNKPGHVCSVVY